MIAAASLLLALPTPIPPAGEVVVRRPEIAPARLALWRASREETPSLRGFRAPVLEHAAGALVLHAPPGGPDVRTALTIATRLARDGVRATLVAVVADRAAPIAAANLAGAGLPIDLLACWTPPGAEPLIERVARELAAGRPRADVAADLDKLPFAFPATIPGWRIATESGEHDAAALRLQVSSATDYALAGQGGALDVFRELARLVPDAALVVGVESKHLAGVEAEARTLAAARNASITLIESPLPLAQWAQDSAKAGIVENGGPRSVAWLAPRYASRGEVGSTFVPGENLALEGFAATGRVVRASPLLFQAGDLLAVADPRGGKRSLLVGEAEIARNRALGLTRDEVLAAFRAEFGVDSCVVLPAVSFHVDLEVTVRATEQGLVACVLDTATAARTVIRCGVEALGRSGALDAEAVRKTLAHVDEDRHSEFFEHVGPILQQAQHGAGRFALDLAERFSAGPTDSGVGNLQRFLLAIDLWTAAKIGEAGPADLGIDPDSFAYLSSLRRREVDRMRVATALGELGWTLAAIPGLSDEARSLDPLNGIQLRGRYLMPAYGGIFAPLDELARERLTAAFGPGVRVDPVLTGETQRRSGGLHCAASVEPSVGAN